jgi:hypothetical protein
LATDLLGRADKVGDPRGDPIRIDVGHVHSVDDLTVTQLLLLLRERIDVLQGELKLSGRELWSSLVSSVMVRHPIWRA